MGEEGGAEEEGGTEWARRAGVLPGPAPSCAPVTESGGLLEPAIVVGGVSYQGPCCSLELHRLVNSEGVCRPLTPAGLLKVSPCID